MCALYTLEMLFNILRNRVTSQIRKENIDHNNNRVMEAKNEGEIWKIANEVTSPKQDNVWKIDNNGVKITDELKIAEIFNKHFVEKLATSKITLIQSILMIPYQSWKKEVGQ